ncbi:ATP-grasp domain-containing protein [Candidatus Nomurabacteria bacterium]|nr:ATP-grasp domain-containing protein [Candidatus Nomurabacteria bacterium]
MMALVKKYVVFVGNIKKDTRHEVLSYIETHQKKWQLLVLHDKKMKTPSKNDMILDFDDPESLRSWVAAYGDQVLCITARSEKNITLFKKLIPYVPKHILTPTVDALEKSTEKTKMRKAFKKYDPSITPRFKIIKDIDHFDIDTIATSLEFPVIVKPSGLAASLLIQAAHYKEELEHVLASIQKRIKHLYQKKSGRGNPSILIEEMIEGNIYSVDAYVDDFSHVYFLPFVKYQTSAQKGFDDFFLYERTFPKKMHLEKFIQAQEVARIGIQALGIKNTTTHIELVYTGVEWKIIEIGPRIGGNRHDMYMQCYGINHTINDILIRMGKKPLIKNKAIGFTTILYFFPQQEGYITKINGVKKIKQLESFSSVDVRLKKGDRSLHAKNGGEYVLKVTLYNKDRPALLRDKRKLEKLVHIETSKQKTKKLSS